MVNRLVAVDDANYDLPSPVRARLDARFVRTINGVGPDTAGDVQVTGGGGGGSTDATVDNLGGTGTTGRALMKTSTPAAARDALGVAAQLPVGSGPNTVAAGDDSRFADARAPKLGSVTNDSVATNAGIALSKLAPGFVSGQSNGAPASLTIWTGTESQYAALGSKSATTVYFRTA